MENRLPFLGDKGKQYKLQFASWERVIGDERGHHFGGQFEGYWLGMGQSPHLLPPIMPIYAIRREVGVP